MSVPPVGRIGIWSMELRFGDAGEIAEAAAELDELGYGAVWIPGGAGGDITGSLTALLNGTKRATIASGIINVWKHEPQEIADWWHGLSADHKARTLLGIGISHAPMIGEQWGKPIAVTRDWVERLTALGVPADSQCLAALGPKMVALSGELTAGAHPYLVSAEHSAVAREILGPDKLLAPEHGVVLETDLARVREIVGPVVQGYGDMPNYRNSWKRLGFSEEEIAGLSDRLVDALFAWGSPERIAERLQGHFAGGADHVCLQVIAPKGTALATQRDAWRSLAAVLL